MLKPNLERWDDSVAGLYEKAHASGVHRRTRERILAIREMAVTGACPAEMARRSSRDVQALCDWVRRYNEGGVENLAYRYGGGRTPLLSRQSRHPRGTGGGHRTVRV